MHISKSIIINIGKENVVHFLKENGIPNENIETGQEIEYVLSDLIESNTIDRDVVQGFFYNELMFGKRRRIRVYNLEDCNQVIFPEDWLEPLKKDYGIQDLEFNNIITSIPNSDEKTKIAAIHTEYNEKLEIRNINILFCHYIEVKEVGGSCCYIPVCFDLEKKLLTLKVWRRHNIADDERYKQGVLLDNTIEWLQMNLNYTVKNMGYRYKEILYNMNKSLVRELFNHIPVYQEAKVLEENIDSFSNAILDKLSLENKIRDENGRWHLPAGVMDVKDELVKLIQRLAVADYFMERDYEDVWNMGISAIVNSVRFNAVDNVLAVISGEDKRKPVFCSNSFLALLKSMEESQMVETIWISFKYEKRTIRVNYNAADPCFFEIGNLSGNRNFTKEEFEYIWEVLMRYESVTNVEANTMDAAEIS